jgi:glycosyltransferase involved in cell wall biosynthesis
MNVGIVATPDLTLSSHKTFFPLTDAILREKHTVSYRSMEYLLATDSRKEEIDNNFLEKVDVLIGPLDPDLLRSRARAQKPVPYAVFLQGETGRGLHSYSRCYRYLTTSDILVGNCTSDVAIVNKFFQNATTRNVPFPFDESLFHVLAEDSRQEIRGSLGIDPEDKVLLYSGRLTLEKNVHTLLRLFSVLKSVVPNLHLVLAGPVIDAPASGFGAYPLNLGRTFSKMLEGLNISGKYFHLIGDQGKQRLRELYSMADICVNMTLHHDENFGLAQVEAMACGTPVVGSNWGGLKDTVVDGTTGFKVSTVLTKAGVKVHWLEAVSTILFVLRNNSLRQRLRDSCRSYAQRTFSAARYSSCLESLLEEAKSLHERSSQLLEPTLFARQFWEVCGDKGTLDSPAYCQGSRAFELYRQLIGLYSGTVYAERRPGAGLRPDEILCLATPVRIDSECEIEVNDPIYPMRISIPAVLCSDVKTLLYKFNEAGVMSVQEAQRRLPDRWFEVLDWMIEAGVVLRIYPEQLRTELPFIETSINVPLLSIQRVNLSTDIAVVSGISGLDEALDPRPAIQTRIDDGI